MKHHTHRGQLRLLATLFLFVIACTCGRTTWLATPTPAFTEVPQPSASPVPTESPVPDTTGVEGLQPEVPWLIVSTTDGL